MKKYRVKYTGFSTTSWGKIEKEEIVFANSEQEAKDIIQDRSCMGGYDYYVDYIEEVKGE